MTIETVPSEVPVVELTAVKHPETDSEPHTTEETTDSDALPSDITSSDVSAADATPPSASVQKVQSEIVELKVAEPEVPKPKVAEPEVLKPKVAEPEVPTPEVAELKIAETEIPKPEVAEPVVAEPVVAASEGVATVEPIKQHTETPEEVTSLVISEPEIASHPNEHPEATAVKPSSAAPSNESIKNDFSALRPGIQEILAHAQTVAEERASCSSRMLLAKSLISRQEKLREKLMDMRHDFTDFDSEIRALKLDAYKTQQLRLTKH